jgi:protein SCO1/2
MKYISLFILAAFLFTSCSAPPKETPKNSANVKRYELRGRVVSVDKANKTASIDHEEIPGFMEAMTMDFPIKEDHVWDELKPGVEIQAELVVDNTADPSHWLEKIAITASSPGAPTPEVKKPDQIGKLVPDFSLTNQDGKNIKFSDLKGKATAVTFIYRQCPLPEFCIKMSRNFSDAAQRIIEDPEMKEKVRLLSISFDPEHDTPEKLKQYGIGYLGNDADEGFKVWQLAVGPDKEIRKIADFFGLEYTKTDNEQSRFDHTLVTAVISPEGKVVKILAGSRWTVNELINDLKAAAEPEKTPSK